MELSPGTLRVHARRHVVDARLTVPLHGGITVLFGPSGAGKTTVLRCIAGLERTQGGEVVVAGEGRADEVWADEVWDDGAGTHVPPRRRRVGYLFQDHALFPHLGVLENVAYGLPRARSRRAARTRAATAYDALTLAGAAGSVDRRVRELSGGEAQRVALARALAPRPRLLLLDEPLSALDLPTRLRLRTELRRVLGESGIPAIVVTHDRSEALALADRVVVMIEGRVRQVGTPEEVFDRPSDPDVARVVGIETAAQGRVVGVEDDLVRVDVGGCELTALALERPVEPHGVGDEVLVCVRAEDVALELPGADPQGRSPRNRMPARVTAVTVDGALVRVALDAGFGLTAYITRPALAELGLRPGSEVVASVKSPAVHLITRRQAASPASGAGQPT